MRAVVAPLEERRRPRRLRRIAATPRRLLRAVRAFAPRGLAYALVAGGLATIIYGVSMIWLPAAILVLGAGLVFAGLLVELDKKPGGRP